MGCGSALLRSPHVTAFDAMGPSISESVVNPLGDGASPSSSPKPSLGNTSSTAMPDNLELSDQCPPSPSTPHRPWQSAEQHRNVCGSHSPAHSEDSHGTCRSTTADSHSGGLGLPLPELELISSRSSDKHVSDEESESVVCLGALRPRSRSVSECSGTSSKSSASRRSGESSGRYRERHHSPRRRPSWQGGEQAVAGENSAHSQDPWAESLQELDKALRSTGNLVLQAVCVRALRGEDLSAAYRAEPKLDSHMPAFDAKVDPTDLIGYLRCMLLNPNRITMQRVLFMSTEWLGIRLSSGTTSQCLRFCICAAALRNVDRNTSRSVVIEACDKDFGIAAFACAPLLTSKHSQSLQSWLALAADLNDLADIVLNEVGLPQKKALRRWSQRHRHVSPATSPSPARSVERPSHSPGSSGSPAGSGTFRRLRVQTLPDSRASPSPCGTWALGGIVRRLSLSGIFGSLEDQFESLVPREQLQPGKGNGGDGDGSIRESRRDQPVAPRMRRRSAPELGFAASDVQMGRLIRSSCESDTMQLQGSISGHGGPDHVRPRRKSFSVNMGAMPIVLEEDKETTLADEEPKRRRSLS